jgi:hypothetical protein
MMKRVLEAFLYDNGAHVQGYRATSGTVIPMDPTTHIGWHMITAYWRDGAIRDYHFATKDYDPINNLWVDDNHWSDKEGCSRAERTNPFTNEDGTLLGQYLISTAPRDTRATIWP